MDSQNVHRLLTDAISRDVREAIGTSFMIGMLVAERANGIDAGTTPPVKVAKILAELICGEATLLPSGTECQRLFSEKDTKGKNIEASRKLANDVSRVIAKIVADRIVRNGP